jgi:hypothetical protein
MTTEAGYEDIPVPKLTNGVIPRIRVGAQLCSFHFRVNSPAEALLLGVCTRRREVVSVCDSAEDFQAAIEILPQLELDLFTEGVFPLKGFHRAWDDFRAGEYLKILLEVDGRLNEQNVGYRRFEWIARQCSSRELHTG